MNLLIVEDEPVNRKLLHAQLEAEGHSVVEAANGAEALRVLEQEKVDGIISDILMPDMDGFRLCLEIRKREKFSELPFVFYTSTYSSPQDQQLAREVGADDYITKPSPAQALISALYYAGQKTRQRIARAAAEHDEAYVLKQYNHSLVRKLEQRNIELEETFTRLRDKEEQLRLFVEHAPAAIAMLDRQMKYLAFSRRWLTDYKLREQDIAGRSHYEIFPEIPERWKEAHQRCLAGMTEKHDEDPLPRADGTLDWIKWEILPWRTDRGEIGGLMLFSELITERKQAEIEIRRLNRVYAMLSGINTLIVRADNRDYLFREVCRLAVEHGGFALSWIGLLPEKSMNVVPMAWAGKGGAQYFNSKAMISPTGSPEGQGIIRRAVQERRPVFTNDIFAETFTVHDERRQEAIRLGYRSAIALPLVTETAALGCLTLFSNETNIFNDAELRLLMEMANDIVFALDHMKRQEKIDKLSRIRALSSEINAAIVRSRSKQELFDEACRIAIEHGGFGIAWVGEFDEKRMEITPIASAGIEKDDLLMHGGVSVKPDTPLAQGAVPRAVRERRPIFINDLAESGTGGPRRQEALRRGYRSAIALPLLSEGFVVGVFSLFARELNFFDEEEVSLLTELASNVSYALEHMARQQKIGRLSRMRALMSDIDTAIVRAHDHQQLLAEVCRIAVTQGSFELAWTGIYDPDTARIKPLAWAGEHSEIWASLQPSQSNPGSRDNGITSRAVRERTPVIHNDLAAEADIGSERRREAIRLGFRSSIALPLTAGNQIAGSLTLYSKEPNLFNEEEIGLLTELAGNVSYALDHMAKQRRVEQLSRVQAFTSEINSAIIRSPDKKQLLDETCRIAVEHGGFGIAWIGALDPATLDITPVAWAGGESGRFSQPSTARADVPEGQGALGISMRERRPVYINDITKDSSVGGQRRLNAIREGFRSLICLPLMTGENVTGNLTLLARELNFFSEDEVALLTGLTRNISFALDYMARQQKIDKLSRIRSVLGEINAAIVRVRNRQELLTEACRIAAEAGGFAFAWIGNHDRADRQVVPVAWAGAETAYLDTVRIPRPVGDAPTQKGLVATAVREKAALIVNDVRNDPRVKRREMHIERGIHSIAVLPLFVSDEVSAVLALHARDPGYFDEEETDLLAELAGDIGFALQTLKKQEQLDFLSYYDALTGLPNRTLFLDRASQNMRMRSGEDLMVAMILINLERFRNINDTLGRQGGDDLLKLVGQRLEQAFDGKDQLARLGSDGFGVIVRGIPDTAAVAHLVEDRVFGCFREPFQIGGEFRVAVKAGISMFPTDGADVETLFNNAEAALKQAKQSGERYLFYSTDMNARTAHILSLETRLRKAVEARQFVLHYQSKIDLAHNVICGVEALIRWQDPDTGLVPPETFIPILEETGLIVEVGQWAITQALADHREWTARGHRVPRIAVNVSAIQLQQKNFTDIVIDLVQREGDNPEALEFELTESLLMKDVEAGIRKLSILRGLGIHIAMDDFGTGHSSLSYIARLPINSLKIDRSFIIGMAGNPQDMAIVTTIITLAHSLNLRVVAEGVESSDQAKLLRLLKCDEAQGYFFSKPLPAAEVEPLLRESGETSRP